MYRAKGKDYRLFINVKEAMHEMVLHGGDACW